MPDRAPVRDFFCSKPDKQEIAKKQYSGSVVKTKI